MEPKNLRPSPDNPKVAHIKITNVGDVKVRGFDRRLHFGKDGQYDYTSALQNAVLTKKLSVRVVKDVCGDYFAVITFSVKKGEEPWLYLEMPAPDEPIPVGIDVGVKDIAILSSGEKVENRHFKREKSQSLAALNRKLSRRWGPANMAFRDYNKAMRSENRGKPEEERTAPAKSSNRYLATKRRKALIERRIARQRETYYHQQTAELTRKSSMIALETLHVKNMLRNHKLAYALADAAMSDFLSKLKYKAERRKAEICCIGTFEPTSQVCSVCGEINPLVKNLSIRNWTCPKCGAQHDRDVNAAKNILRLAIQNGSGDDSAPKEEVREKPPPKKPGRRTGILIYEDMPEIAVVYSKELTGHNDPRYVVQNVKTKEILDDAQGVGYRSASNAKNCYKAKRKWSEKNKQIGTVAEKDTVI